LILNIVFAWEHAVAMTSRRDVGLIASHRFPMYLARDGKCDLRFVLHYLLSPQGKELLDLASPGGAGRNRTLGQAAFEAIKMPCPPLSEQTKIAEALDTWDRAIEMTQHLAENVETQRRILLDELVTGIRSHQSGTHTKQLSDVLAKVEAGVSVNGDDTPASMGQVGVLKISSVTKGVFDPTENKVIRDEEAPRARVSPRADRVIVSRCNTASLVGASAYVEEDFPDLFLPDKLWLLSPKEPESVSMRWLAYWLSAKSTRDVLSSHATGSSASMKNISKEQLLRLQVPLPPLSVQTQMSNAIGSWDASSIKLRTQVRLLRQERQQLLVQLFRGTRRFASAASGGER
jgi:type I restriction enzyme S subunit